MADLQAAQNPPHGQVERTFAILEAVASQGSASAKSIAERTSIPLPTVYRACSELIDLGYMVHLRAESRFALGYRLHVLAKGLHDDIGVPLAVRREVRGLHNDLHLACYLAVHRGTDFVVVDVADSADAPRLGKMGFGFHESPHATAFGKIGLASLSHDEQHERVSGTPLQPHTPNTRTDPNELLEELAAISESGVAWEHEEFQPGISCAAAAIRAGDGLLIGSLAISAPSGAYDGRQRHIESRLRASAARASRAYRLGANRL